MGRLPFDPDRMRRADRSADEDPPRRAGDGVLTVSRLASLIGSAIDERLPRSIRVVGEVSGTRRSTHLYFSLKDAGAVIGAVVFANKLRSLGFEPDNGRQVVATGRVEFYQPQGRVTLIVDRLEPVGEGAAEARFRQLCEELRVLGWFSHDRKRPLPSFPRRVAVVTSPSGAALQDVLSTMAARCPAVSVALVPVRVQGKNAAGEVVRAVDALSRSHTRLGIDAVILTRGGGSAEDLAAFNDREIARAIVECRVPVVAAIGHETDTTIAELVADERCATPTQAAVRLTPDRAALANQLDALARRFRTDIARSLRFECQRLSAAARHPVLADPRGATRMAEERLRTVQDDLEDALRVALREHRQRWNVAAARVAAQDPASLLTAAAERLATRRSRLVHANRHRLATHAAHAGSLASRLGAIGPSAVLARGYSCTLRADGSVARDAQELRPGEQLTTYLAAGTLNSEVLSTSTAGLGEPGSGIVPPKKRKPAAKAARAGPADDAKPDQLDLFAGGE